MPGNIQKITVTTTAAATITATVFGSIVQIQENPLSSAYSQNFNIYHVSGAGTISSVGRTIAAGSSYAFSKQSTVPQPYLPGDIVGFVEPLTATTTFFIDELGS